MLLRITFHSYGISLGIDFLKNGFSWYSQETQKVSAKKHAAYQERPVYSINFAYDRDATVCSYVPKKKKAVVLLSSMHVSREVEETQSAKPKIVKYYNKTKGGVDTMDKMLGEYIAKRRTLRWPLALFLQYGCRHWFGMLRHLQRTQRKVYGKESNEERF